MKEFERNLCKVENFIYVPLEDERQSLSLGLLDSESNAEFKKIEIYFKQNHRFYVYSSQEVNEYLIDESLSLNKDFNIVFGMSYSGKSLVNKHLASNYNIEMIDLVDFATKLKARLSPDDPDSVELTTKQFNDEVLSYIRSFSPKRKFLIENLVNPLNPDVKSIVALLDLIGSPRIFYHLDCSEQALKDRYKKIKLEGSTEELTEEQEEEFRESLVLPATIVEYLEGKALWKIDLDTNMSENTTKENFDKTNGMKFVVIKHEYNINIENLMWNLATTYKCLYINVSRLIYQHFWENGQVAKELKGTYSRKNIGFPAKEASEDERIYYKYNPIHFDEALVTKLINNFISNNSKENESSRVVLLTGFLNFDLLEKQEQCFNLPLYEIRKLKGLGTLRNFIQITSRAIQAEEILEPEFLEPPKKPEKPKDDLDVSGKEDDENKEGDGGEDMGNENMDGQEEGDEAKKKFTPFNKFWNTYDGEPRNYLQILKKLTAWDLSQENINRNDLDSYLYEYFHKTVFNGSDQRELKLLEINK